MSGGGGSGGFQFIGTGGGGYAGQYIKQDVDVISGTNIQVVVGAGGASKTSIGPGNPGGSSKFGNISVAGGAGGGISNDYNIAGYGGNGGYTTIWGINRQDGYEEPGGYYYLGRGGQAGAFGNGGKGVVSNSNGRDGQVSAGGGGNSGTGVPNSGAGGRGEVRVYWGL
ncbi:MAG: hypothetical protein RBR26_07340 [Methanosarcina mazei]|nr:hypothetical protein [Methanosarcina mazei]